MRRLIKINIYGSGQRVGEPVPWRNSLFNALRLNLEFYRVHPYTYTSLFEREKKRQREREKKRQREREREREMLVSLHSITPRNSFRSYVSNDDFREERIQSIFQNNVSNVREIICFRELIEKVEASRESKSSCYHLWEINLIDFYILNFS